MRKDFLKQMFVINKKKILNDKEWKIEVINQMFQNIKERQVCHISLIKFKDNNEIFFNLSVKQRIIMIENDSMIPFCDQNNNIENKTRSYSPIEKWYVTRLYKNDTCRPRKLGENCYPLGLLYPLSSVNKIISYIPGSSTKFNIPILRSVEFDLYDQNIFIHLIEPFYYDLQREYWSYMTTISQELYNHIYKFNDYVHQIYLEKDSVFKSLYYRRILNREIKHGSSFSGTPFENCSVKNRISMIQYSLMT